MQQSAMTYVRGGNIPFFRLRSADLASSAPYAGADAVVLGVPYDGGATHHPGARFAPYHVRRVSALVEGVHPVTRMSVFEQLEVLDGGNVVAPPFHPPAVREMIQVEADNIRREGAVPIVCGGDHTITLPLLRSARASHGPVALLHVDAHFDTSGPEVWGEPHHHGTYVRHAIDEGLVEKDQLYQLGIRATWKTPAEAALTELHGGRIYGAESIDDRGLDAIMREIVDAVGERPLYLSFDIDAVDPAYAPGTGTPVPGGLTSREAIRLVRALRGLRLVGMDMVEVLPAQDHADITCHLAAHLMFEAIALLAHAEE